MSRLLHDRVGLRCNRDSSLIALPTRQKYLDSLVSISGLGQWKVVFRPEIASVVVCKFILLVKTFQNNIS